MIDQEALWFNQTSLHKLKDGLLAQFGEFEELSLIDHRLELLNNIIVIPDFWNEVIGAEYSSFPLFADKEEARAELSGHLDPGSETVTAVVLTRNEERSIHRCLQSLLNEVDDIVIIDTGSSDATLSIIESIQSPLIHVHHEEWKDDFSAVRNVGIDKSAGDWIFFIDADEWISRESNGKVKPLIQMFSRFPLKHSLTISPLIVEKDKSSVVGVKRIFHRASGIRFFGDVHEEPRKNEDPTLESQENINIELKVEHDGYQEDILQSKKKIERNISLLQKVRKKEPENPRWIYFLVRDGMERFSADEMEMLFQKGFAFCRVENYQSSKNYTIPLTRLLLQYRFKQKNFKEVYRTAEQLEKYHPEDSDALFFSKLARLFELWEEQKRMLQEVVQFRDGQSGNEYGALHPEGLHIDCLIGALLFETGMYERAKEYFDFLDSQNVMKPVQEMYQQAFSRLREL
ncbi:glycosyltransferase [Alteribacillus sp. HJP-4]|uniref:glycosyltransferase n=1 Tax=Alteribacillus sp. HJP-4 TaxID=2775394 RepID=UPI0035CCE856